MANPENHEGSPEVSGLLQLLPPFRKNYSTLARPLFNLTKKDVPFHWDHAEEQAFHDLQSALTSAPVLILPDYEKPFTLITNASNYMTGSILE